MPNRAMIGIKATPAEYVEVGRMICKQRRFIAKNPNVTRRRHYKIYPGINVSVLKSTSLTAAVSGRIKMTHDVERDVQIMNVLPEPREELLRDDLWRYRTEHVKCMQENQYLCHLRTRALPVFGKEGGFLNPPVGVKPMRVRISQRHDTWNNPGVQDPMEVEPFAYPLPRHILARHIKKVRRKQAGLPDEDPSLEVTDTRFHLFKGQASQR
jgi:ribosomal protein L27